MAGRGLSRSQIVECLKRTSYNPITNSRGRYDPVYGYGICRRRQSHNSLRENAPTLALLTLADHDDASALDLDRGVLALDRPAPALVSLPLSQRGSAWL